MNWGKAAGVGGFAAMIIAGGVLLFHLMIFVGEHMASGPEICREEVGDLRQSTYNGNVPKFSCSHDDHTLLRGNEEGTVWICLCDPIGCPRARRRADASATPDIAGVLP